MKSYYPFSSIYLFLFLFLSTHFTFGFKNPYRKITGTVIKVKELKDHTLLAIFENNNSGYVELSHISNNGDSLSTTVLSHINQKFCFQQIYEYNGEYIISMGSVEANSTDTIKYQEFRFYDTSLNLLRAVKHIVDGKANGYDLFYNQMNEYLTWAGVIKQGTSIYLKTIQFGQNGENKKESLTNLTFADTAYVFLKVFHHQKGSSVFLFNRYILSRFDYDSSLNLLRNNSFPTSYRTDSSGKLYKYNWVNDVIAINDSQFVGILGDTSNGSKPGDSPLNSTYQSSLIKIQDTTIISSFQLGRQYFWWNLYAISTHSFDHYINYDTVKKEIYVLFQYNLDLPNPAPAPFALKFSNNLDSLPPLLLKPSPDIDTAISIRTFDILQSGTYVIGGRTKSNNGFLGIVNNLGLVSGIRAVDTFKNITVFPNPGKYFMYGIPEQTTLQLIDITGKKTVIEHDKNGCDISTLNTGIYFYQIIDKQGNIAGKGKYIKE